MMRNESSGKVSLSLEECVNFVNLLRSMISKISEFLKWNFILFSTVIIDFAKIIIFAREIIGIGIALPATRRFHCNEYMNHPENRSLDSLNKF